MPSGLFGQPLAGRLSAILADVSTNRDRKPTTQCPWKEFSSTHVNHKDSSETIERIPEETGAYKLSKERREYKGDKTWIFGGPENGK